MRLLLPRCWFDEEKCRAGLEALTFYRKTFNERLQEFTDRPLLVEPRGGRLPGAGRPAQAAGAEAAADTPPAVRGSWRSAERADADVDALNAAREQRFS